jgi:hypothetical protein
MVDASGIPVPSGPITLASLVSLFEEASERASRGDSELLIDADDLDALQARAREVRRTGIAGAMARSFNQGTQTERDMQEEEARIAQAQELSRLQRQRDEAFRRAAERETRLREHARILEQNMQSFDRERENNISYHTQDLLRAGTV